MNLIEYCEKEKQDEQLEAKQTRLEILREKQKVGNRQEDIWTKKMRFIFTHVELDISEHTHHEPLKKSLFIKPFLVNFLFNVDIPGA